MPAPLAVNREEVRMLVMSIGVREAARKLGIAEGTVQAWSARGDWLAHATNPQPVALPASMQGATVATKPADALAEILANDEYETRVSLSKSARRMAQKAEDAPLEAASDVLSAGKVAALVHRWQAEGKGTVSVQVNIGFFEGSGE